MRRVFWKSTIDYSRITFADFLFCTSIQETLSISLKAAKEIKNFFVFRKLIRTFSIQKNCVQATRKNTLMRLEKYPTVPHFLSSNFMRRGLVSMRRCTITVVYNECKTTLYIFLYKLKRIITKELCTLISEYENCISTFLNIWIQKYQSEDGNLYHKHCKIGSIQSDLELKSRSDYQLSM